MTDRPVIMSAPMVRACLREVEQPGTGKTQTRRVWKLPTKGIYERPDLGGWEATTHGGGGCFTFGPGGERIPAPEVIGIWHRTTGKCLAARYQAGDRLWVREAHAMLPRTAYRASVGTGTISQREHPTDGDTAAVFREGFDRSGRPLWRPSIHMPRWASRLTLLVTEVRVERLQDISEGDALAEGALSVELATHGAPTGSGRPPLGQGPRSRFRHLWNSLHGLDAWDANPWVVAITFRPVLANIDAPELARAA